MEFQVKYLTRRRSGDAVSRDEDINSEALNFGRGTASEVELADPRVQLLQGTLHVRPGGLFFEAPPRANVSIDSRITTSGPVRIGSIIEIGPYDVVILEPPEGKDAAVSVELTRPAGDAYAALTDRSVMTLDEAGWGTRKVSWGLAIIVLAAFLIWPMVQFLKGDNVVDVSQLGEISVAAESVTHSWPIDGDKAWDTGEISRPHRFFGDQCGTCHQKPFVQVEDTACVACHSGIEHHFDPGKFNLAGYGEAKCQTCHKEHAGSDPIIMSSQESCSDCHKDLDGHVVKPKLTNAGDFGAAHPQFRPAVIIDGDTGKRQRLELDASNPPVELSNLRFPHDKHLKPEGVRVRASDTGEKTTKVMQCADCHQREASGVNMRPIAMREHCAECHSLAFSPADPSRMLPHGDFEGALHVIREFYADLALRGGVQDADAPASVRRRPGIPLSEADRPSALQWARKTADSATDFVSRSVCGYCHVMARDQNAAGGWRIKKVMLAETWFEKSWFPHNQHQEVQCTACHKANASKHAGDVLLPGIDTCRSCHGGAESTAQIPSTCVDCHQFHLPDQAPMLDHPGPRKTAQLK